MARRSRISLRLRTDAETDHQVHLVFVMYRGELRLVHVCFPQHRGVTIANMTELWFNTAEPRTCGCCYAADDIVHTRDRRVDWSGNTILNGWMSRAYFLSIRRVRRALGETRADSSA